MGELNEKLQTAGMFSGKKKRGDYIKKKQAKTTAKMVQLHQQQFTMKFTLEILKS